MGSMDRCSQRKEGTCRYVESSNPLTPRRVSLRSYDATLGFRNIDERSSALSDLKVTHTTGMAMVLAGAIKGRDIIRDAQLLRNVAADVLKIHPFAFEPVVLELAELELIRNVRRKGGQVASFTENIPILHDSIYEKLGESWSSHSPSELEQKFVATIDELANGPVLLSELRKTYDITSADDRWLRQVATQAELVQFHTTTSGDTLAVSPLYAFENPEKLFTLFEQFPIDKVREAFTQIRQSAGFPVLMDSQPSVIKDILLSGLMPAPTVTGADKRQRAFIVLPYGVDPVFTTTRKHVLERAIATIACIRCGEISGGITAIKFPDRLLARLMDKDRKFTLGGHSSTARQYAPLIAMGMIHIVSDGYLDAAQLVPTQDNLDAVQLARNLLNRQADGMPERGNEQEASDLLLTGGAYLAPLETISLARRTIPALSPGELSAIWNKAAGWGS
ncbi:MAG TPA: hypothetical protein VMU57_01310 [Edaphobacter sp.]|uniref:hypothetical protein n=1 Tax=Edaphobacter sp. TaxID=1934404 RepID=UPI002CED5CB2|nr:hypothetical protein [Edaphobacter sp.]HUZ93531.1 hypothetical protein [Edaphobacter sp.]